MSNHARFRLWGAVAAAALLVSPSAGALPPAGSEPGSASFGALPAPALEPLPAGVPPANDAFGAAEPVPSLPFAASASTLEATTAPDDPSCAGNAASVWYAYTPPVTVWLTAHTFGSGYDTTLSAYTGTQGALLQVACNDDGGGQQSQITFLAQGGVTHYLMAAGGTGGGALELALDIRPPLSPSSVRTTRAYEISPAAGPEHFAWSQWPYRGGRFWTALVQPAGEARFHVNRSRTHGYASGFDGDTFVYQEVRRRQSNIVLYDLVDRTRSSPPGVNTRLWEWHATLSGDWMIFGRRNFKARRDLVILRNLATGETRLLDRVRTGRYRWAEAGQVSGNYAVWYHCATLCRVFRHDIAAATTTAIPNGGGLHQYEPTVTDDGTVYFLRSPGGCGVGVRLVRHSPAGIGTVLAALPRRWDSWHSYALENGDGTTSVFFERSHCRTNAADILKVVDP